MNNAAKLGAGVAGGYLLGRTKKLKLAIGLGAWLMGKRLQMSPSQLAMQGFGALRQSPEFAEITDRLRNEVGGAGRKALSAAATSRMESLADKLRDRNEGLDDEDEDYDEPDDAYDEEIDEDEEDEDDDAPRDEDEDYDDTDDEDEDDDAPRDEDEDYDDTDDEDDVDLPRDAEDDYDDEDDDDYEDTPRGQDDEYDDQDEEDDEDEASDAAASDDAYPDEPRRAVPRQRPSAGRGKQRPRASSGSSGSSRGRRAASTGRR